MPATPYDFWLLGPRQSPEARTFGEWLQHAIRQLEQSSLNVYNHGYLDLLSGKNSFLPSSGAPNPIPRTVDKVKQLHGFQLLATCSTILREGPHPFLEPEHVLFATRPC